MLSKHIKAKQVKPGDVFSEAAQPAWRVNHDIPGVGDQEMFWTSEMTAGDRGTGSNDGGGSLDSDFASTSHAVCATEPSEGG